MEIITEQPKKMGRPSANIDWDKIDPMLEADCDGVEVASYLGIHPDTLYIRCMADHKMTFSAYRQQKKAKGDSKLKITQFRMALNEDRGMLIWLGKNRLNQKDVQTSDKAPNDNALDKLTDEIKAHKPKELTNCIQIINSETKV